MRGKSYIQIRIAHLRVVNCVLGDEVYCETSFRISVCHLIHARFIYNLVNYVLNAIRDGLETIHLLPTALYNDRPVGELLIRGLYDLFWLRHGAWNQVWLALHAINIALFMLLVLPWLPPMRLALAARRST